MASVRSARGTPGRNDYCKCFIARFAVKGGLFELVTSESSCSSYSYPTQGFRGSGTRFRPYTGSPINPAPSTQGYHPQNEVQEKAEGPKDQSHTQTLPLKDPPVPGGSILSLSLSQASLVCSIDQSKESGLEFRALGFRV